MIQTISIQKPHTRYSVRHIPRPGARYILILVLGFSISLLGSGCRSAKTRSGSSEPVRSNGQWQSLFDGNDLIGWKTAPFGGEGQVTCRDGNIVLGMGDPFTGIVFTNPLPKIDYEVSMEARRIQGSDFFCGLTFPYEETHGTLIVGGWGGSLVGLSSIDGLDASENETTRFRNFEQGRWYQIKLRVRHDSIEAWIDGDPQFVVSTKDRRISLRAGGMYLTTPFGITTWNTTAEVRDIRLRELEDAEP